jgi:predicted RNA-binding Zn-ribbon protein involved in translation (DUF1610 family)
MSKSRPQYANFALDHSGARHLVITDQPLPPEELEAALAEIEIFTVHTIAPGVPAPPEGNVRPFRSAAELLSFVPHHLARQVMGLRLYALGSEAFIWDVHHAAEAAGMGSGEIRLTRLGPLTRRVYCTHCRDMIEEVPANIVTCPGCGAMLFVRDHFSRRLRAFMGVKANAEDPAEVFVPEAFTS